MRKTPLERKKKIKGEKVLIDKMTESKNETSLKKEALSLNERLIGEGGKWH